VAPSRCTKYFVEFRQLLIGYSPIDEKSEVEKGIHRLSLRAWISALYPQTGFTRTTTQYTKWAPDMDPLFNSDFYPVSFILLIQRHSRKLLPNDINELNKRMS
jgi:hypothetical protein